MTKYKRLTLAEALEDAREFQYKEATPGIEYRAFRWQDGVR